MELVDIFPAAPFVVYVIIDRLKVHIPPAQHRLIPDLSALTGLILAGIGLYVFGPYNLQEWVIGLTAGVLFGYSATGINQGRKQREV